jgi:signal transduction histidine kinase
MEMRYSTPGIIMIFTAIAVSFMAVIFWKKRRIPGGSWFFLLIHLTFLWALFGGLEEMVTSESLKVLYSKITYFAVASVAVVWFTFLIRYLGIWQSLKGFKLLLLWIIPVMVIASAWTNELHGLVWPTLTRTDADPYGRIIYGTGPMKMLILVYSYVLILFSTVITVHRMIRSEGVLKKQYWSLLIATTIPWIANIMYNLDLVPAGLEITPLSFTVLVAAILWSMSRNNLFDLMPVAFDVLFRSMSDCAFVLDNQNRLVEINESAQQVLNLNRNNIGIVPQPDHASHIGHFMMMKEGQTEYEMHDGTTTHWFDVRVTNLHYQNSKNAGKLYVFRNISQRKSMESELLKAKELAEAASKTKSDFLATMSHEIRTPLNAIIGFTDLLKNTELSEAQKEYVKYANVSGHTLLEIINDILDFSKIEAGLLVLEKVKTNLLELLENSIDIIRFTATKKNINVLLTLDETVPRYAMVDPTRLMQVLANLLGNAVKFTHEGEVELKVKFETLSEDTGKLHFSVRDTGIGIADHQKDRLFKVFSQADSSTTRKFGGTGLGLIISDMIVQQMGGKIEFVSKVGQGSTFYFELITTVANSGHAYNTVEAPPLKTVSLSKLKILIVEDMELNMMMIKALLSNFLPQAELVEAHEGSEAVELASIHEPDLILMDIQMPGIDGIEATRLIRKMEQDKGSAGKIIIALTAGVLGKEKEKCLAAGMNDFMTKPLDPQKFRILMQKYL